MTSVMKLTFRIKHREKSTVSSLIFVYSIARSSYHAAKGKYKCGASRLNLHVISAPYRGINAHIHDQIMKIVISFASSTKCSQTKYEITVIGMIKSITVVGDCDHHNTII